MPAASEGSLTQGAHDVLVDAGVGEGGQIRLQLEENLNFDQNKAKSLHQAGKQR